MQPLFDYLFYRIYRFSKERGDNAPETNGSLLLSLMQFLTLIDIMVVVKLVHDYTFPPKFYFLAPLILIAVINWFRYEEKIEIEELDKRWNSEDESIRIRNGWFIGLYLVISFLIPALYGYLHVNLKVI